MAEKKVTTKFQQPFSVPKVKKNSKPVIPVNKTDPTTSENADIERLECSEKKKPEASSMTDEQYESLFDAVLKRVQNTPTDELVASLPKKEKQAKVKPKLMKKGTPTAKVEVQINENDNGDEVDIVEDMLKVPNNTQSSEAAVAENVEDFDTIMADEEEEVVQEIQSVDASVSHNLMVETSHDAMYMINLQSLSGEDAQGLNETTPEGSELEFEAAKPPHQETPPRKIKKSNKSSSSKKQKLAPRQLMFPKQLNTEIKKKEKKEKQKKVSSKDSKQGLPHPTLHRQRNDEKQIIVPKQSRKEQMMTRDIETQGTWVQCCQPTCSKWRYLSNVNDPTEIPEKWTCSLNTDEDFNSCEKQQQQYNEENHIFTKFTEGSIVWARMTGYPWWPAMIEIDPDTESYFELITETSMIPSHYHVVFFDTKVSRAWVRCSSILPFNCKEELVNSENKKKKNGHNFQKEVNAAKKNAEAALELPIQERLKKFSFSVRFVGKWGKTENSDERQEETKKSLERKKREKEKSDINLDMLDLSMVDEIMEDEDSVLKGIEEAMESLDSQKETKPAKTKKCSKDAKRERKVKTNSNSEKKDTALDKFTGKKKHKESKKRKITDEDLDRPKLTEAFDCDRDVHSDTEVRQTVKAKSSKKSLFVQPEIIDQKVNSNEEIKQKTKEINSVLKVENRNKNVADKAKQAEGLQINDKTKGKKKQTKSQNCVINSAPKNKATVDSSTSQNNVKFEKITSNSNSTDISCSETKKEKPVKKKSKMSSFIAPKAVKTAVLPDNKNTGKCAETSSDAGEQLVPDPESQLVDNIDNDEFNLDIPIIDDVIKSQEIVVQELIPTLANPIEVGNDSDPFDMEE